MSYEPMKYIDKAAIKAITRWSDRTIYNQANKHQWRRTKTRPTRYHVDDIYATLPKPGLVDC